MSRHRRVHAWSIALACALVFVLSSSPTQMLRAVAGVVPSGAAIQDPVTPPQPQEPADPNAGRGGRQGGGAPVPYAQLMGRITGLKSDDGIFKVHRGVMNGTDSVLFEIPNSQLDKDFVWNVSIKKTTIGAGLAGQEVSNRVVRWSKRGDRIVLYSIDYSITGEDDPDVSKAVADANYPAIISTLPIAAYTDAKDASVVDVTNFFMDGVAEFRAGAAIGAGNADRTRSFLEHAVSFDTNINVESTLTFSGGGGGGAGAGGGRGGGGGVGLRGPSGTVVVHHSIMRLPDKPMMSRKFDERVGYDTAAFTDFGTDEHRSVRERIITRYRLEKKDPNAAVSEPVKPIVFYIDPATPAKWVPFVKRGVESWQAAFEAAGFRNAIVAMEAPKGDANWSAEDARYSVVRWVPTQNEQQAYINDPRSGEILAANIAVYPNVNTFGPTWYFVQAGPLDKRAQKLPLPDDVTGELLRFQVAHQIGHALGLAHNLKSSALYTVAQVRDPKWVKENSFVPSIMDDARFNYVAQPEDNVDPTDLIPKIGPYDKFAIAWGYKPVPNAKNPDAERPTLDQWAREQDKTPYLRFSTEGANAVDEGEGNVEAVGDMDAVAATTLGLKNLDRVSQMMFTATSSKVGDPWDDLEAVYNRMVAQWSTEVGHVVKVIGGMDSEQVHIGQTGQLGGARFKTVPKAKQIEALNFLISNAFTVPAFMVRTDVLRRIQPSGVVDRVRQAQMQILTALLQNQRLDRMTEEMTIDGATVAYSPMQFMSDLRAGVFSEASKPGTAVNLYRRNLQRSFLTVMDEKLNTTPAASAEIRMLVKGELKALKTQVTSASAAPGLDENTRRHYQDVVVEIDTILDPRVNRPAPDPNAAAAAGGRGRGGVR